MPQLPELDTVSFDANLPFGAQLLPGGVCPQSLRRETRLALRVLAAPVETTENPDPLLLRLEAKLDLALEVSLLDRHPERPPLQPCRLGLEQLAWQQDQAQAPGESVLMTLYPNADSSLIVFIAGQIVDCRAVGSEGYHIRADISRAFDEITRPLWEKWVFRRHRRAILGR
ncbi:hypothetical protein [Paludibacterium yongneupense]|uniref:hypothetical protein n=1 Tax=Paludibacterium yongneupense TaxID=400061 RepID=UPI00040ABFDE|nr:hypothetical protein [Paludibacterium yongneupense]